MAKGKSGLPDGFDIGVSAEELTGAPATIAGYLDEDPVLVFAKMQRQKETSAPEPTNAPPPVQQQPAPVVVQPPVPVTTATSRKRFQINLDAETERMLEELLELLSSQSSENEVKISELFQALLMILYRAKGEIALGSIPERGRWGSPTAKAFPVALAEALREAIVLHEQMSGGNPFKRAVGS